MLLYKNKQISVASDVRRLIELELFRNSSVIIKFESCRNLSFDADVDAGPTLKIDDNQFTNENELELNKPSNWQKFFEWNFSFSFYKMKKGEFLILEQDERTKRIYGSKKQYARYYGLIIGDLITHKISVSTDTLCDA